MKSKKNNDTNKYFKICVELECEQCKKRFVVPVDRFFEGKDFCSLHCNTQYQDGKERLFFDKVEKTYHWRTHRKEDMLPETKSERKESKENGLTN